MYSQRKADTPEANVILASGIFCSSRSDAMDLSESVEQDLGAEGDGLSKSGSTYLSLSIGQENSSSMSLSSSLSTFSLSEEKRRETEV